MTSLFFICSARRPTLPRSNSVRSRAGATTEWAISCSALYEKMKLEVSSGRSWKMVSMADARNMPAPYNVGMMVRSALISGLKRA